MTEPDEAVQTPLGAFTESTSFMGISAVESEIVAQPDTQVMLLAAPDTLAATAVGATDGGELPPEGYTGNNEFFCDPLTSDYDGVILVHALDMPDGWGTLYREDNRGYVSRMAVRGGQSVNPRDGFVLYDTEAPFNSPVYYILKYKPSGRVTLYNYISNPSFEGDVQGGVGLWRAGTGRNLAQVTTGEAISGNCVGEITRIAVPPSDLTTWSARLLAHGDISMASWKLLTPYRIGGWVKVQPNDLTTWAKARSTPPTTSATMTVPPASSWSQVRSGNKNWKDLVTASTTSTVTPSLYVSLVSVVDSTPASTPIIVPVKVTPDDGVFTVGEWVHFTAYITTPDDIPGAPSPNIDLAFYTGSTAGESTAIWSLDALIMDDVVGKQSLSYFDGYTDIYEDPNYLPGMGYSRSDQESLFLWDSGDASVKWEGTPNLSRSIFTAASEVAAYTARCTMEIHEDSVNGMSLCEPVYISDPIIPSYSMWTGLLSIAALERAARRELLVVYGRHAPIALSEQRASVNTTLTLMTNTLTERESMIKIVDSGRIIMLRNPDVRYPETNWYMSLGDVSEERILPDHRDPRRRWKIDVQLVDRPAGSIASIDGQTWGEAKAQYATWGSLKKANAYWMTLLIGRVVTVATADSAHVLATTSDPGLYPTAKAARWSAV